MSLHLLNLSSGVMAGAAIGGAAAALETGSPVAVLVVVGCALNAVLLRSLATTRAAGGRMDAVLDRLRALRPTSDRGRW